MALSPDFESFRAAFEAGQNQVVWTRLAADLDTPVSLMLRLAAAGKHAFMLESVTGGEVRGRYSIVGMNPDLVWECRGDTARINREARYDDEAFAPEPSDPLSSLRALLRESRIDLPAELPSASAGLFGYLGYDMIRLVEHLPDVNPDPLGLPDAVMLRPSVVAVLDGVKGDVILVAPAWAGPGLSARAAFAQAAERVMDAQRALDRPVPTDSRALAEPVAPGPPVSNFSRPDYEAAVETAKAYIRAGDIFQVVPSQRWTLDFPEPPFALYRSLRRTNPSPFMFFFNFGGFQVIGASPEILVRVMDREVTIRPIAGTRPRGDTPEGPSPRGRTDGRREGTGRAPDASRPRPQRCGPGGRIGTVRPTEEFTVERYSHVMHIVSNVVGELAEDQDALSAFFAGMPAGTVSGAPKVRAMEIIDELEPEKRGIYGGGLGYFSARGDMDMCIALRTAIVADRKLHIQAGGGVVFDSDPAAEYMETVHKSNALRRAAEDATRFRGDGN